MDRLQDEQKFDGARGEGSAVALCYGASDGGCVL